MSEKIEEMSFEQAVNELSQLVKELEQGDLPLDKALSAFQRGVTLSQHCNQTLKDAEKMVQELASDEDGIIFQVENE